MTAATDEVQRQLGSALQRHRRWILAVAALISVYLLVPMLIVIPASFTSGQFLQVPPDGFSLRWYIEVLNDPLWADSLLISLRVSGLAAIVAVTVGTLAVVGLARFGRGAGRLRPVFFLPMVLPYIVFALGLRQTSLPLGLDETLWPLIVGQAVLGLPIAFLTVASGMSKIDPLLSRAARSMGASWWCTVWRIEIPLLRRSIFIGWLLAFAFAFDEVVLALFLAPPGQNTLPAELYTEASQDVSPLIASVSGLVLTVTAIAIAILFLPRVVRAYRPYSEKDHLALRGSS